MTTTDAMNTTNTKLEIGVTWVVFAALAIWATLTIGGPILAVAVVIAAGFSLLMAGKNFQDGLYR